MNMKAADKVQLEQLELLRRIAVALEGLVRAGGGKLGA